MFLFIIRVSTRKSLALDTIPARNRARPRSDVPSADSVKNAGLEAEQLFAFQCIIAISTILVRHISDMRVFISNSNGSKKQLQALANQLLADGIDAVLEQDAKGLSEEWPRWISSQLKRADHVLVTCHSARKAGEETVFDWENMLSLQGIYDNDLNNPRFIPIFLDDTDCIPTPLRTLPSYRVDTREGYESLYNFLTIQPRMKSPATALMICSIFIFSPHVFDYN